jgi:hypothetical protein
MRTSTIMRISTIMKTSTVIRISTIMKTSTVIRISTTGVGQVALSLGGGTPVLSNLCTDAKFLCILKFKGPKYHLYPHDGAGKPGNKSASLGGGVGGLQHGTGPTDHMSQGGGEARQYLVYARRCRISLQLP